MSDTEYFIPHDLQRGPEISEPGIPYDVRRVLYMCRRCPWEVRVWVHTPEREVIAAHWPKPCPAAVTALPRHLPRIRWAR